MVTNEEILKKLHNQEIRIKHLEKSIKNRDAIEDDDNDGVVNAMDNCIDKYNKDQTDSDKDGIGNVCDSNDERFFEENKYLLFIFAGIIVLIFLGLAIVIMKNNK